LVTFKDEEDEILDED
jgi:ABC-type glutathione transport system ATPase component